MLVFDRRDYCVQSPPTFVFAGFFVSPSVAMMLPTRAKVLKLSGCLKVELIADMANDGVVRSTVSA